MKYKIQKIVFANNISELYSMEKGGEIVTIDLMDDIESPSEMGFVKEYGNRERNNMVSPLRKGDRGDVTAYKV